MYMFDKQFPDTDPYKDLETESRLLKAASRSCESSSWLRHRARTASSAREWRS